METPDCRISLADLSAAGIRLQPSEAAAVAWDVIQRAQHGHLPGIPLPNAIRFVSTGTIEIDGPVASGHSVERAGRLLDAMLPGFDAPPELRAPGALRIVVARALRTLDLPPYRSLDELTGAIARFAVTDHAAAVRTLCATWMSAMHDGGRATAAEESVTISDIRRARRATGLTLKDIADRSRIPISLLRELEWGYFPNWPADRYGRTQLVRYARAAGLDEDVVVRAVWPLLQAPLPAAPDRIVDAEVIVDDSAALMTANTAIANVQSPEDGRKPQYVLIVGAIAALLTIGLIPALWNGGRQPELTGQSRAAHDATPSATAPAAQVKSDVPPPRIERSNRREQAQPAPRPVAFQDSVGFSPAFATTGSAMFYHSAGVGNSSIMRADTDGNGAVLRITRVVNDDAQNFHARPSPDGRMIAFDSDREGERAVYIADADGRDVRRVTGAGFAAVPSWSPDGGVLAYVRAEADNPRVWNIWTVDLATGHTTRLTSHRVGQPWGAAWFPDGQRIAYSHEDRLVVRSIDGRSQQIYPSPRRGRLLRTPAVSPDGRHVMFQVHQDGGWLLDLSDASMRRILTDPTAEEFTWSPDGARVAYHSRKSGTWSVWVMAPR